MTPSTSMASSSVKYQVVFSARPRLPCVVTSSIAWRRSVRFACAAGSLILIPKRSAASWETYTIILSVVAMYITSLGLVPMK